MRQLALFSCAALLVGCAKADQQATTDTTTPAAAVAPTPPPPPPPIALSDVAGTWDVKAMAEGSDSVLVTYTLTATADTTGWSIKFPSMKQAVPVHVMTTGSDSLVLHAGPYNSILRKGVKVKTDNVVRLQGGKLVGNSVAHYTTTGPDSVLRLRTEGTKKP